MNTDQTGSWTLPDEYVMLGDTVRRFMEREVRPVEERLEHDATNLPTNELTRLQGMAREMSVWCNQSPSEYGGGGLNLLGQCVSGVDNGAWGILYARTGAGGDRAGITAFIIAPKRPGMSPEKIGLMRAYQPFEIHFENYEIPVEDLWARRAPAFPLPKNGWYMRAFLTPPPALASHKRRWTWRSNGQSSARPSAAYCRTSRRSNG